MDDQINKSDLEVTESKDGMLIAVPTTPDAQPVEVRKIRRRVKVNERFYNRIRTIIQRGAMHEKDIYPLLNMSSRTWSRYKVKHPMISEVIEEEFAKQSLKVKARIRKIVDDPSHSAHWKALKHVDDQRFKSLHAEKVEHVHRVETRNEVDDLGDDELLKLLDSDDEEDCT